MIQIRPYGGHFSVDNKNARGVKMPFGRALFSLEVKNEDDGRFSYAFRGSTRELRCYLRSMRSLRSFHSNPQELQLIPPPGGYLKLAPVR